MRKVVSILTIAIAVALGAGLVLLPVGFAVGAAGRSVFWGQIDAGDVLLSGRQWRLVARGVWVAVLAAGFAQLLGAGLAAGMNARRPRGLASVAWWLGGVVLLMPPYVYAYAWSLPLLPEGIAVGAPGAVAFPAWVVTTARAAWCLALWTAPVAAVILAGGWRVSGRPAVRLALQDATAWQALWRVGVVATLPWLLISVAAVFVLAVTEYSVCHLCLVSTWNTEVLATAQIEADFGRTALLAWPLIVVVLIVAVLIWPWRGRLARLRAGLGELDADGDSTGGRGAIPWWSLAIVLITAGLLASPFVVLLSQLRDLAAFGEVWRTYPHEWPMGLLYAGGAGALGVALALAVDYVREASRHGGARRLLRGWVEAVTALAVLLAVAPPALVGDAWNTLGLRAASAWPALAAIVDHWPMVSLVTAARFAAIPLVAVRLAGASRWRVLLPAAMSDGADWRSAYWRLRLPLLWPTLLATGVVVALLSLTEVAAAQLVRPPGTPSLALTLLNQIHYGRNDQIIALCTYVFLATAAVVAVLQVCFRRN